MKVIELDSEKLFDYYIQRKHIKPCPLKAPVQGLIMSVDFNDLVLSICINLTLTGIMPFKMLHKG